MLQILYNIKDPSSDQTIDMQSSCWYRVIQQCPNTIINCPEDVVKDCWFLSRLINTGKQIKDSEPFKSFEIGNARGAGTTTKSNLQSLIFILANPTMRTYQYHNAEEVPELAQIDKAQCSRRSRHIVLP